MDLWHSDKGKMKSQTKVLDFLKYIIPSKYKIDVSWLSAILSTNTSIYVSFAHFYHWGLFSFILMILNYFLFLSIRSQFIEHHLLSTMLYFGFMGFDVKKIILSWRSKTGCHNLIKYLKLLVCWKETYTFLTIQIC